MSPLTLFPFKWSTKPHLHIMLIPLLPPASILFLCSLIYPQGLQFFPHSLFKPIQREFCLPPSTKSTLTTVINDLPWSKGLWLHLSQEYQSLQVFLLLHQITLFSFPWLLHPFSPPQTHPRTLTPLIIPTSLVVLNTTCVLTTTKFNSSDMFSKLQTK